MAGDPALEGFLQCIRADNQDDTARLALADYLDENNCPLAATAVKWYVEVRKKMAVIEEKGPPKKTYRAQKLVTIGRSLTVVGNKLYDRSPYASTLIALTLIAWFHRKYDHTVGVPEPHKSDFRKVANRMLAVVEFAACGLPGEYLDECDEVTDILAGVHKAYSDSRSESRSPHPPEALIVGLADFTCFGADEDFGISEREVRDTTDYLAANFDDLYLVTRPPGPEKPYGMLKYDICHRRALYQTALTLLNRRPAVPKCLLNLPKFKMGKGGFDK